MRALLVAALVALGLLAHARPADACVRASEANRLLGWSADGAYALLALVDDDGTMDHAEILPTAFKGFVYVITEGDVGVVVTKVKVGQCADFGDEDAAIVERKKGKLTEALLRNLKTVKAMKFGTDQAAAAAGPLPTATFTGAKRYATHDLTIVDGATTTTLPVPVWCVGSCMADENWTKWKADVTAVHALANGVVLYELRLAAVCNGGTLIRLVQAKPPKVKVPKRRCLGSGQ